MALPRRSLETPRPEPTREANTFLLCFLLSNFNGVKGFCFYLHSCDQKFLPPTHTRKQRNETQHSRMQGKWTNAENF